MIIPASDKGQKGEAAKIILFALECLVDLVNAKGSVLSMWALDPPLFILLASDCGLQSEVLSQNHPRVHLALVQMLTQHCKAHHHFLASSQLLTSSMSMTMKAPTAEYFELLLKTIVDLLTFSR